MWKWLEDQLAAFMTRLCVLFRTPQSLDDGRRANVPPPEGGISSIHPR